MIVGRQEPEIGEDESRMLNKLNERTSLKNKGMNKHLLGCLFVNDTEQNQESKTEKLSSDSRCSALWCVSFPMRVNRS